MLKIGRKFFPCLARALVPNGDMFLFVVVSRQTKKGILCVLCVSAVKCPNPYLHNRRKSAVNNSFQSWCEKLFGKNLKEAPGLKATSLSLPPWPPPLHPWAYNLFDRMG